MRKRKKIKQLEQELKLLRRQCVEKDMDILTLVRGSEEDKQITSLRYELTYRISEDIERMIWEGEA